MNKSFDLDFALIFKFFNIETCKKAENSPRFIEKSKVT